MSTNKTCIEEKQTGCILLVAILLTAFSLSGFQNNSQPLKQATQIELVLSYNLESTKGATYIYEIVEKYNPATAPISKIYAVNYWSFYERLIETRFKSVLLQTTFSKISDRFYPIKTIPQNSKEDSFISFIG